MCGSEKAPWPTRSARQIPNWSNVRFYLSRKRFGGVKSERWWTFQLAVLSDRGSPDAKVAKKLPEEVLQRFGKLCS